MQQKCMSICGTFPKLPHLTCNHISSTHHKFSICHFFFTGCVHIPSCSCVGLLSLCSLVLLVFLNVMLFYKLWMLEYSAQSLTSWQGLRLHERYNTYTYYNCITARTILCQDKPTNTKIPPTMVLNCSHSNISLHPQ